MITPTIKIELTPEAKAKIASLSSLPQRLLIAVSEALNNQNLITVSHIHRQYLSFPRQGPTTLEGLRTITRRLIQSVRPGKAVIQGNSITCSIGSDVPYAAVHEFGYNDKVMVGGHVRERTAVRQFLGAENKKGGRKTVTRTVRVGDTNVVAHSRSVNLPERRPIRRGIEDTASDYSAAIGNSIMEAADV